MARIRTIKPEFWTDEAVTQCSPLARLLFIGTWNMADDAGNLDRSAQQLKFRLFPTDKVNCEPLIQELITHGLLIEYSVNGKKYLHIPGFGEHQSINRPSKPTCPDFDASLMIPGILTDGSVSTPGALQQNMSLSSVQDSSVQIRKGAHQNGKSVKTPIPETFSLTEELSSYIAKTLPDSDPQGVFDKFCDQARAKDWRYADWSRALQTYCRNAIPNSGHFAAGQYPRKNDAGSAITWR